VENSQVKDAGLLSSERCRLTLEL